MNEPTRRDALRELAGKADCQSSCLDAGTPAPNYIEAAQVNGHSNTQIVEAINKELGVSIKLKDLRASSMENQESTDRQGGQPGKTGTRHHCE